MKYYARASRHGSRILLPASTDLSCSFLAAKSSSFPAIASAAQTVLSILQEIRNHKAFCGQFSGISEEELDATPEASATTAYGLYLMDMGIQGL